MADDVDAFMATMVMRPHALPLERAVSLAREHYGLEARAARLTGERDENFRISAADGGEFVLKVAHPAESPEVGDLINAALLHLERYDPRFPCPRVVRERRGDTQIRFSDDSGAARTARLLSYLPGSPLGNAASSRRLRAECGRLGGRLTRALQTFEHPGAHRPVVWDVRHAAYLVRLLGQVPGFPYPADATAVLERIVPRIESGFPRLRQQIVHNDLNPLNLLVSGAGEVTGIIDFGDMTHTAVIADVAVTAAEHIPQDCAAGGSTAAESVRDIVNAYHESLPLLPEELAILGTLVAARLVANLVVHEWHLHHNPASEHYRPLDADFIRERLKIAAELSLEEGQW
jgi:Ser/Thr protein kinase RdoA (MazF antagonist)